METETSKFSHRLLEGGKLRTGTALGIDSLAKKQSFVVADAVNWQKLAVSLVRADKSLISDKSPPSPSSSEIEEGTYVQVKKWSKRKKIEWMGIAKISLAEQNESSTSECLTLVEQEPNVERLPPELQGVLDLFSDLFQEIPTGGIRRRNIKHHIPTLPDRLPVYPKQCYNLSDQHLPELKKQLKDLLEKQIITPSQSPIAAPVFFVSKKDGTLRIVIDYRALNAITIREEYPIPRIHDLINRLGKAKWFSTLDLQSGYYQVEVSKPDQWKTAFRTRYGTFQFTVMPFGLAGAPSTFQKLMQNVFFDELDKIRHCLPGRRPDFFRDPGSAPPPLSTSCYKDEKRTALCQTFQMPILQEKDEGVSADPDKLSTLREWPEILTDRKQLHGFLGLVGYYRRLVPNLNRSAHSLHRLLCSDSDVVWRQEHSEAVRSLKEALVNAAALKNYDPDKSITIKTDALKHAIGAVLEKDGVSIAFESRKMSDRERFLPAFESELLAIVYALMKWKSFIGTKLVTIQTDHATLGRILQQKNVTTRLGYWLDKLAGFNIEVIYKPGKQNVVADAISRRQDFIALLEVAPIDSTPSPIQELANWKIAYAACSDFKRPHAIAVDQSSKTETQRSVLYEHPYHPQTEGQTEPANQEIEQMLRCALIGNENTWESTLPLFEFAYNSTQHSSTKSAPFELLYGFLLTKPTCQQLRIPTTSALEILPLQAISKVHRAKQELTRAQKYQKQYADHHRRPASFEVGQKVWLWESNLPLDRYSKALRPRFVGPFPISRKVGENAVELKLPPSWLIHPVLHVSLLQPMVEQPPHLQRTTWQQQAFQGSNCLVEGILDHCQTDNEPQFLVQALDGPTTWMYEQDLQGAKQLIKNYFRGRTKGRTRKQGMPQDLPSSEANTPPKYFLRPRPRQHLRFVKSIAILREEGVSEKIL
ncbi:retrotransposable element tf2 155 kda protein type 1 [Cystoisospora suis]|uniref:Retrotransposable element tf2 155 kDa protein type 1 n=1 Tax=Cystoisospora suis TaxID=483139 RepID=A0A2C6JY16_9APIC|nr:retrotransposable element tf2 155 kda protein type 1 [Cystoisospora suis]